MNKRKMSISVLCSTLIFLCCIFAGGAGQSTGIYASEKTDSKESEAVLPYGITWGMNLDEVTSKEPLPISNEYSMNDEVFVYSDTDDEYFDLISIGYIFKENKLDTYVNIYKKYQEMDHPSPEMFFEELSEKFGELVLIDVESLNQLVQNIPGINMNYDQEGVLEPYSIVLDDGTCILFVFEYHIGKYEPYSIYDIIYLSPEYMESIQENNKESIPSE